MKHSIFSRVLLWYLAVSAILITALMFIGAFVIEKYLTYSLGHQYYAESMRIASDKDFLAKSDTHQRAEMIEQSLEFLMGYQQCIIWITDPDGHLLFPDDTPVPENYSPGEILRIRQEMVEEEKQYVIGDFYDILEATWLSVIAPVYEDSALTEYIVFHYPMSRIYRYRRLFQRVLFAILITIMVFALIPLFIYQTKIRKPLEEITEGARKYSEGILDYQIPVRGDNDLSYVARSLNYMADHLDKNNEYQLRFLANISHDFRSPLTSIKGFANAMRDGVIPPDLYPKYLGTISYEADRLEKLTHNLTVLNDLDVNRHELNMEVFDINQVILQVLQSSEELGRQGSIRLTRRFENETLMVRADEEKIQQVLYNLIDNAIKFSPSDSEVVVQTYCTKKKAFISVKDHGKGIAKDELGKIWDRFYKTDSSRGKDRKGSGLGLSIVRDIINAHNERINVISTEGVGTEFLFTLPRAD